MGCTLIIGRDEDLCCRLVREHLASLRRRVVYLQEDKLFPGLRFTWELSDGASSGALELAGQAVEFDQIHGVLARFSGIATSPEDFQTKDGRYLSSEWHALTRGFIQSLLCPVVNRPGPELWYRSALRAPELVSLVPDLTFRLPRTMVATCFEEARSFFDLAGGRIYYSPLTVPSDYLIDTERALQKLEPLSEVLPLHLSEVIAGEPVDAYVVGTHVVFDGVSHTTVGTHCQAVAESLGLTLCHLRIVLTAEGEWYCMSVNGTPTLFECAEQPRNAIVGHLVEIISSETQSGAA